MSVSFSAALRWPLILGLCGAACCGATCVEAQAQMSALTTDGRLKSCPQFLDEEGRELIYVVEERPTQWRLMRLTLEDGTVTPVSPTATNSEFDPAWSNDGKHLAFVQSRGNLSLALVIRNMETLIDAEVPPAGGFAGPRSPTFSADGQRVLFSFAVDSRQRIDVVDLAAGDRRTLIESSGIDIWPDCSADGRRLAWTSSRDDDFEIYSAAMDGTDLQRLTKSPRQDLRPRFSPDSKRIAFSSHRDGNSEIYLMDADGGNLHRITDHPERDDYPSWHPRGDRLVIVAERRGQTDLYLVSVPTPE